MNKTFFFSPRNSLYVARVALRKIEVSEIRGVVDLVRMGCTRESELSYH